MISRRSIMRKLVFLLAMLSMFSSQLQAFAGWEDCIDALTPGYDIAFNAAGQAHTERVQSAVQVAQIATKAAMAVYLAETAYIMRVRAIAIAACGTTGPGVPACVSVANMAALRWQAVVTLQLGVELAVIEAYKNSTIATSETDLEGDIGMLNGTWLMDAQACSPPPGTLPTSFQPFDYAPSSINGGGGYGEGVY